MLLDEYQIISADGRPETHYEYALDMQKESCAANLSSAAAGIGMIERYVSGIVERPVEFYLIYACRFFSVAEMFERRLLTMDISISQPVRGEYSVRIEITDKRKVLVEVNGSMRTVAVPREVS